MPEVSARYPHTGLASAQGRTQNTPCARQSGGGGSTRSKRHATRGTNHIIKPRHNGMPLICGYPSYWRLASLNSRYQRVEPISDVGYLYMELRLIIATQRAVIVLTPIHEFKSHRFDLNVIANAKAYIDDCAITVLLES